MARLATTGFEWQEATADGWSALAGTPAISTSTVRSGTASLQLSTGATSSTVTIAAFTGVLATGYYARTYLQKTGTPSGQHGLLWMTDNTNVCVSIVINTDSTVQFGWGGTGSTGGAANIVGSTLGPLNDGQWYMLEVFANIGTGTVDSVQGRLDGALGDWSASGLAITDSILRNVRSRGSNDAIFVDDFALNDTTGAAQTSWPGSGKVVLLKPISDSAVGTGWTLGTGTAISGGSGSTAVKNTPPVGVADLTAGSDTKQIRNASSNANVNYDANLTTYAAAGVGASDTVNVLVPMVATGAPVVTSAKAGTFGISANPAIANVSLGAGGTAGAFWSGVAAGTYPTGWKWSFGTATYAPTVTVGSSPVARITQVTASTRIADVCAMGMYVDYTPAVALVFNASEGEEHSDPRSLQIMGRVSVVRGSFF